MVPLALRSLRQRARDTCIVHTPSSHDVKGLPFSGLALLPLRPASPPWCPQSRGPAAALLPHCSWRDLEPQGSACIYLPSHIGAPGSLVSQDGLGPFSQALLLLLSEAGQPWHIPPWAEAHGSTKDRRCPHSGGAGTAQRHRPQTESVLNQSTSSPQCF